VQQQFAGRSVRSGAGVPHQRGLVTLAAVTVLATPFVHSASAETTAFLSVDGGAPVAIPLHQGVTAAGGDSFSGSFSLPGEWSASVVLNVHGDLADERVLTGTLETVNLGSAPRFFDMQIGIPVCAFVDGATIVSATTRLQLVANAGGGFIKVPAGSRGLRLRHDGAAAAHAFEGPFFVTASGAGVATVLANFGNNQAPALMDEQQMRLAYELSDGDIARLLINRVGIAASSAGDVGSCVPAGPPADLNGDGVVNMDDLLILFGSWGKCDGCAADLDGDGRVNVSDLMILLTSWTM